jgi:uncharacterized repeat protein (TIGR02543 family)
MKKLSSILLSLTALVIIMGLSFACQSCQKPDPAPVPNPTAYTVSFNANGGTGSVASQTVNSGSSITLPSNSFSYTGYTFVSWNTNQSGTGTSYNAGASYTVTSNVTLYAIWQQNAPTYTAVFTATDLSSTEALKSLPGNSADRAIKLNVTTSGSALLSDIGVLTNGSPAIAYYWIVNKDSVGNTSTLNPVVAKTIMLPSQTINLLVGTYVICFKTAPYSGAITNGTKIGLSLTGANANTVSNANYTADASHNATTIVKVNFLLTNNFSILSGQNTKRMAEFVVKPCSDENGTSYDGNVYPNLSFLSFDTKDLSWFTGTTTGYNTLDFTNAAGPNKQDFNLKQDDNGAFTTNSTIFQNSDAAFSNGILQFSKTLPVKLVKSSLGTYSNCSLNVNIYNSGAAVGTMSACWMLKGISFTDNPEIWIYDPNENRIF